MNSTLVHNNHKLVTGTPQHDERVAGVRPVTGLNLDFFIYLDVSLYCTAPKRTPDWPTLLMKGLATPTIKPFTCRKLILPMLEDPSIKKTMSAA